MSNKGVAADVARQREEVRAIVNMFLAQLVPGSEEYNQLQSEGQRLIDTSESPLNEQDLARVLGARLVSQQQQRVAAGGSATPAEARTQAAFDQLRETAAFKPEEQDVLASLRGESTTTPSGSIYADLVNRARNSDQFFTDTTEPEFQQVLDLINQQYSKRGLLDSGLRFESLGRAGVDLAIKGARERENFRQQQLGNFEGLFNVGQQLRGREIGVEEAMVDLQSGRESKLTDLLGRQSENSLSRLDQLLQRQTDYQQSEEVRRRSEEAERNNRIGRTVGTVAAVGAAPFTGGASLAFLPAVNSAFPSPSSGAVASGQPTSQLSRQPASGSGGLDPQLLAQLAKLLAQSGGGF